MKKNNENKMKKFNITGLCIPEKHWMADTSKKIDKILELIENGEYFSINRPRQYGKTTSFNLLFNELLKKEHYICIKTSFEILGSEAYKDEETFIPQFLSLLISSFKFQKLTEYSNFLEKNKNVVIWEQLNNLISKLCLLNDKKIILMIDEVDKSMNNQLFLDFLAMLRNKYLVREESSTFQSVILAGVHDVKSLKLKIRPESEQKFNSPWNIAADFTINMSLDNQEIASMLIDYSTDKKVEMDIEIISKRIYYYTSGYPFLVSKICKDIDEKILPTKDELTWKLKDVDDAVKELIEENNTNFDSLIKNLEHNKDLYDLVKNILLGSYSYKFVINNPTINLGYIYGVFEKDENRRIKIHNKIYEEVITDYLASITQQHNLDNGVSKDVVKSSFLKPNGKLNIERVLLKFQEVIKEKYSKSDILKSDEFLEKDLRLLFLVFLKPILNGVGFCFKEVETSEEKRLDIVILFEDEKFIVELKIWRGQEYHLQGIERLKDYMRRESAQNSYMLIMDKTRHKEFSINTEEEIMMVWI